MKVEEKERGKGGKGKCEGGRGGEGWIKRRTRQAEKGERKMKWQRKKKKG